MEDFEQIELEAKRERAEKRNRYIKIMAAIATPVRTHFSNRNT